MSKPILVGEANPYGGDPKYVLYPHPVGCAGERLCNLILEMSRSEYLDTFERRNLCPRWWEIKNARLEAKSLMAPGNQRLILLGSKVASAFGLTFMPLAEHILGSNRLLMINHPSKACRAWQDRSLIGRTRERVRMFLGVEPKETDNDQT